jgi:putative transposon-encoded protein
MMISAKEAKELYDQSCTEVEAFLKQTVEPKVTEAAKRGHRHVFIHLDASASFEILDKMVTPVQNSAMVKLKELGYQAQVTFDGEKYVPRGLANDDGSGPLYQNYGIQIGW